jgi:hypothetical protein
MQSSGLDAVSAARRVIELAEQVPAPSRAAVGTDAELNAFRLRIVSLD